MLAKLTHASPMATRNINLTEALDRFVDQQIKSGAFQNASEVVRAGLRLLKAQEEERAAKMAAIKAGPGGAPAEVDALSELIRLRSPR
jgi:antitoxin ParD1/3/4